MQNTYNILLFIHIFAGAASLFLFWVPVASRKGGVWHRRSGSWYSNAMYIVAVTAFTISIMVLIDPIGTKHTGAAMGTAEAFGMAARERIISTFLLAIAVLVFTSVRHGLQTLRSKRDHSLMRAPSHVALNVCLGLLGVVLIFMGYTAGQILFYVFAGICITASIGNLRYCYRKHVARQDRTIAHMSSMIGAGIGSYTAFFVFGGNRFIAEYLSGNWQLVPWVLPAVVGTAITAVLTRKYRQQAAPKEQQHA